MQGDPKVDELLEPFGRLLDQVYGGGRPPERTQIWNRAYGIVFGLVRELDAYASTQKACDARAAELRMWDSGATQGAAVLGGWVAWLCGTLFHLALMVGYRSLQFLVHPCLLFQSSQYSLAVLISDDCDFLEPPHSRITTA